MFCLYLKMSNLTLKYVVCTYEDNNILIFSKGNPYIIIPGDRTSHVEYSVRAIKAFTFKKLSRIKLRISFCSILSAVQLN